MKFYFLLFFFLTACSSLTTSTPQDVIEEFYKSIFSKEGKVAIPYSLSFIRAIAENEKICKRYAGTDICGWGANGDIFLNSQEYSPKLEMNNSGFKVRPLEDHKVKVTFNVYPELKNSFYDKELIFFMKSEKGTWVIDNILYIDGKKAKEIIENENQVFLPKN